MLLDIFSGVAAAGEYVFMLLCMLAAWQIGKSVASDWKSLTTLVVYYTASPRLRRAVPSFCTV
jgi:hypothetical protein